MIILDMTCDSGHTQRIEVTGMSLEFAKEWAALLDGTSSFFVYNPIGDPTSQIGKCGICRKQIHCIISEDKPI